MKNSSKVIMFATLLEAACVISGVTALGSAALSNFQGDLSDDNAEIAQVLTVSNGVKVHPKIWINAVSAPTCVLSAVVAAVIFSLFLCAMGIKRKVSDYGKGPDLPHSVAEEVQEEPCQPAAPGPSLLEERVPVSEVLWFAPPPIPEGPLGAAITKLRLLDDMYFQWQKKDSDDPNPDAGVMREMFQTSLPGESMPAVPISYPPECSEVASRAKDRLLMLKTKGGDAETVAEQVIADFDVKANEVKKKLASWLWGDLRLVERQMSHLIRSFKTSAAHVERQNLEDCIKDVMSLEERAKGVLEAKVFQYIYTDEQLFQNRAALANKLFAEFKEHMRETSDAVKDRGGPFELYDSLATNVKDLVEEYDSKANAQRIKTKAQLSDLSSALKMLTIDVRLSVMFK